MPAERPAWAASHVGRVRSVNQDACLVGAWRSGQPVEAWRGVLPSEYTWAVIADGMGGHRGGEVASRIVIDTIAGLIRTAKNDAAVGSMLETANQHLFEGMYSRQGSPGMGTTVVGVILSGQQLTVFNVGDSRAYLLKEGELVQLSQDDTLNVRHGGALTRSHALTQSLGGTASIHKLTPHLRHTVVQPENTILLCSDGLTDMIEESEVAGILSRHPYNPIEHLLAAALDAGGDDNISIVVIGPEANSQ